MTARVKTESSELRTPKKPAISQAAESCHWMAYFLNSPSVEASKTARNPKIKNTSDQSLLNPFDLHNIWYISFFPAEVGQWVSVENCYEGGKTGEAEKKGKFEPSQPILLVNPFHPFITLWSDCAGPKRLSRHKSDLSWRRQPGVSLPGYLSFSPALTTPVYHSSHLSTASLYFSFILNVTSPVWPPYFSLKQSTNSYLYND